MAALNAQTLRVGTFTRHLLARSQAKAKRKRALVAGLTLTSMVDMFSLLVIFLLQTFSAAPESAMAGKSVSLPAASSLQAFADAPVLALAKDGAYLDQKSLGAVADVIAQPDALNGRLVALRERWLRGHPGATFDGRLILQADRDLSSPLVSQIMALLPAQGYSTVQLAVVAKGAPTDARAASK